MRSVAGVVALGGVAWLLGVAGPVEAQGLAPDAAPGGRRIADVSAVDEVVGVAVRGGYGFTEGHLGGGDAHHRLTGSVAARAQATSWLALGLRFDGRYDRHTGASGDDDGWTGDPRLYVRAHGEVASGVSVGGTLQVWLPGGGAPDLAFDATTLDLVGHVTYRPEGSDLRLAARAGFRYDRSLHAVDDPDALSLADQSSLGVNDGHAVLVGAAAFYRVGSLDLFGEVAWDIVVGDAGVGASPLWISAGARLAVTDALHLAAELDASPSSRPVVGAGRPRVAIEPRVSVSLGLGLRFGLPASDVVAPEEDEVPAPVEAPPEEAGPRVVEGRVLAPDGGPVAGAVVSLAGGEPAATADESGRFRIEPGAEGELALEITAEGYRSATVTVAGDARGAITVELAPDLPVGQLRGSVQGPGGEVVRARLRVTPGDLRAEADEEGSFELDVAPGDYEVVIEADGYRTQRRRVSIEVNGVTLLNVDLRRRRP